MIAEIDTDESGTVDFDGECSKHETKFTYKLSSEVAQWGREGFWGLKLSSYLGSEL